MTVPVRRAQLVTTISTHTKEQLIKWTNCDPGKIVVVPNPLPDEITSAPKAFNSLRPCILVMGTKDNKNVEGIFEAVYQLKRLGVEKYNELEDVGRKTEEKKAEEGVQGIGCEVEGETPGDRDEKGEMSNETEDRGQKTEEEHYISCTKHYKLIVVGKMTEGQKKMAAQYQLDIENLVQVPYEQILEAYKRCDLLCFPSFYEGFGLPIIEAQAIGRPVITSDFGAMKEVAGHGALLVDPYRINELAKAIKDVVLNDQLRNTLLTKGKENVQRFQAKNVAINYASVYQLVSGC